MSSTKLFRKIGYKQRCNNNSCIIYDLKERAKDSLLPDSIIIRKNNKEVEFESDYIDEHTFLGTISFLLSRELLQAINKKIEELEE